MITGQQRLYGFNMRKLNCPISRSGYSISKDAQYCALKVACIFYRYEIHSSAKEGSILVQGDWVQDLLQLEVAGHVDLYVSLNS